MKHKGKPQSRNPSLWVGLVAVSLITALWILLVGDVRRDELILGLGTLIVSFTFLVAVARVEALHLHFRLADIAEGWRIPAYIVSKNAEIIEILFRDLLSNHGAGSFYRVSSFETSNQSPIRCARQVLATFYTTAAPNFIVIGIDERQSRMLFHQLERTNVSKMTKALGARVGAKQT